MSNCRVCNTKIVVSKYAVEHICDACIQGVPAVPSFQKQNNPNDTFQHSKFNKPKKKNYRITELLILGIMAIAFHGSGYLVKQAVYKAYDKLRGKPITEEKKIEIVRNSIKKIRPKLEAEYNSRCLNEINKKQADGETLTRFSSTQLRSYCSCFTVKMLNLITSDYRLENAMKNAIDQKQDLAEWQNVSRAVSDRIVTEYGEGIVISCAKNELT